MIPKIVLDTNILVSALWSSNQSSPVVRIYDALIEKRFVPLYCTKIITEYENVLKRDKFGFDSILVDMIIRHIKDYGIAILPAESNETFPDPDDKVFYCVALAAQSDDAVLVTGNKRHFPDADFILTPSEFIALYAPLM